MTNEFVQMKESIIIECCYDPYHNIKISKARQHVFACAAADIALQLPTVCTYATVVISQWVRPFGVLVLPGR